MSTQLTAIHTEILETAGLASDDARLPSATLTRIVNRALRQITAEQDWPWNQVAESLSTNTGDATFDYTGGAVEDLWSLTAHGLELRDRVRFTVVGTGADEYAAGVDYYVAGTVTANTFQLSTTIGGSVLAGTADSVGTWTLRQYGFSLTSSMSKVHRLSYGDRDLHEYQPQDAIQYANDSGTPIGFYIEDDKVILVPAPDGTYALTIVYQAYETALSGDTDTPALPDRYIDWLVFTCLVQVAAKIRDTDLYTIADRERSAWRTRVHKDQRRSTGTMIPKTRSDWWI